MKTYGTGHCNGNIFTFYMPIVAPILYNVQYCSSIIIPKQYK